MPYVKAQPPGTYEHRGRWCNWCGGLASFYRGYKKAEPFRCTACDRQENVAARVLIESPFAGDRVRNLAYLKAAIKDCLGRTEAPFASHGFYPLVLDDDVPEERALGIEAGLVWGEAADLTVVYTDLGISTGMTIGIERAKARNRPVEFRTLPEWENGH